MELKYIIDPNMLFAEVGSNCTFMELKFMISPLKKTDGKF